MPHAVPSSRLALIERIARSAPAGPARLRNFIRDYYRGVGEQDLAARTTGELAALARLHLDIGSRRRRGKPNVHVFNAAAHAGTGAAGHTIVAIVIDDMPFLVDSVNMVFAAAGIAVHMIVHPVLQVRRDARGTLRAVSMQAGAGTRAESWQLYLVDRQFDAAHLAALEQSLNETLADVAVSVRDWRAMRDLMQRLGQGLQPSTLPSADPREIDEARALLSWMADEHFVFLGYRHYRLKRGATVDQLLPDASTGLGLLRSGHAPPPGPTLLHGAMRDLARDQTIVVITKANLVATVHRATHLDYVAVKEFDARGRPCGEHRFIGLWTSTAYFASPGDIPVLRLKVARVIEQFGLDPASHDGKAVLAVLETYPRDELFQASTADLVRIVREVVNLYERRSTRLLVRTDVFGRFHSCMVYVPRDRYTTEVRQRIEQIILRRFSGSHVESQVQISESNHARVHVVVRIAPEDVGRARRPAPLPDIEAVEREIAAAAATWTDRLRSALAAAGNPDRAARLAGRYASAFPVAYQALVDPADALDDISDLERLGDDSQALRLNLHRPAGKPLSRVFLKFIKRGEAIAVSDLLPVMENFGLRMIAERPHEVALGGGAIASIQDFEFERHGGAPLSIDRVEARFIEAFLAVWRGRVDNDGFNRLLLATTLEAGQIVVLRACARYLVQTGLPFSQNYMERTLANHADVAADLFALFDLQFNRAPARAREARAERLRVRIRNRLDAVRSADEDRILRAYLALLGAMLRTNYYLPAADGEQARALAFKLDPARIPDLPLPRPRFEIFVFSPRVEGVHLRMGSVARGGLRWSDRREDYRTEVLGLMKAQNVKNTLIVPVGAKGGFFPKQLPAGGSRDAIQQEGTAAYRAYIRALLDVTDNIERGRTVTPPGVVRRDEHDPYLVVAADKGTATFSDTANAISVERGFWLGDAFASGGSAGYDHKKMGITARGAWECVKRHFRELGVDTQSQDFTVVGIGDMSGDVFGNGMLLSPHIRLLGAFNHQHIFLDPAPDAARSFAERRRLFALPRSSWEDYDARLISRGGGVFARSAKSIPLSREAQAMLGLAMANATPNELIQALLRLPVDLLWNGGIGTYVKARSESHADVGDRSNDGLRVNGADLRARVVGEGGNLGFTQRGRIEYAFAGGRINTDFIDNSAGVNTSDVEVNLKILLNGLERDGRLRRRDRDRLLASMTDAVGALVLRNNYLQSQAISQLEAESTRRVTELQQLVRALERSGDLNRALEFLPDDEAFAERRKQGRGLTRPELAVLLAYSKLRLYNQLLDSDVPEDPYFSAELDRYFPEPVRRRFGKVIGRHRLRREIIATATTNSLVNRMGPSFVQRAEAETGATPAQIARAYTIAREAFGLRAHWAAIEALDNRVPAATQYSMMAVLARLLRHSSYWLLRQRDQSLAVDARVRQLRPAVDQLLGRWSPSLGAEDRERISRERDALVAAGVPQALASIVACADTLAATFDIVELAAAARLRPPDVAQGWHEIGQRLGLDWLGRRIDALSVEGPWQAAARRDLRDSAQRLHRALVERALATGKGSPSERVTAWIVAAGAELETWQRTLTEMKSAAAADFATLSVGVEGVRKLLR
jgi:glutamate dehydrogenase